MIERLTNGKTLNESESTIVARNSTSDIAKSLNTKYHAKDLMTYGSEETTDTSLGQIDDDEENFSPRQIPAINKTIKELTPKERLLLKKLKKADEEGKKLGMMAKENYEERMLRESFRREATILSV
jgi:hypothetical protein